MNSVKNDVQSGRNIIKNANKHSSHTQHCEEIFFWTVNVSNGSWRNENAVFCSDDFYFGGEQRSTQIANIAQHMLTDQMNSRYALVVREWNVFRRFSTLIRCLDNPKFSIRWIFILFSHFREMKKNFSSNSHKSLKCLMFNLTKLWSSVFPTVVYIHHQLWFECSPCIFNSVMISR